MHVDTRPINKNLAKKEKANDIYDKYHDFIEEKNDNDIKLYEYVKRSVWPRYKNLSSACSNAPSQNSNKWVIERITNSVLFRINRQIKVNSSAINLKNIKKFYNRWYR